MTLILTVLAVALASGCIWITVRIVNRREKWAKRTAAVLALLILAYVPSAGPASYLWWRLDRPEWATAALHTLYRPAELGFQFAPPPVLAAWDDYCGWWMSLGEEHLWYSRPF